MATTTPQFADIVSHLDNTYQQKHFNSAFSKISEYKTLL